MTTVTFGTKTVQLPREFRIGQKIFRLEDPRVETREIDNGEVEKETKVIEHPMKLIVKTPTGQQLGVIEVSGDGSFKTKQGSFSLADGLNGPAIKALSEAF